MTDNKITKVSKTCRENNLEIATNERDKEILQERYISPRERREIIDELKIK